MHHADRVRPGLPGRKLKTHVFFSAVFGFHLLVGLTGTAPAAIRTWDNGGGDGSWQNPANWSADALPGEADTARFDASSTRDCALAAPVRTGFLDMGAGYSGTLKLGSFRLETAAGFSGQGGALHAGSDTFFVTGKADFKGLREFLAGTGTVQIRSLRDTLLFEHGDREFNHLVLWSNPVGSEASRFVIGSGALKVRGNLVHKWSAANSGANAIFDYRKHFPEVRVDGDVSRIKAFSGGSGNQGGVDYGKGRWILKGSFIEMPRISWNGTTTMEFAGSGLQRLVGLGEGRLIELDQVVHSGTGTLRLTDSASLTGFLQTAGTLDLQGRNLRIRGTGDFTLRNGDSNSVIGLAGSRLAGPAAITFEGREGSPLKLLASAPWRINAPGPITARFARIGNSQITGGTAQAVQSQDLGGNSGWTFSAAPIDTVKPVPVDTLKPVPGDTVKPKPDTLKPGPGDTAAVCRRDFQVVFTAAVDEDKPIVLIGKSLCASQSRWISMSGLLPSLPDPTGDTLRIPPMAVSKPETLLIRYTARYGAEIVSKDVSILIRDNVQGPGPSVTLAKGRLNPSGLPALRGSSLYFPREARLVLLDPAGRRLAAYRGRAGESVSLSVHHLRRLREGSAFLRPD